MIYPHAVGFDRGSYELVFLNTDSAANRGKSHGSIWIYLDDWLITRIFSIAYYGDLFDTQI
jgi:hypothetical protein